MKIGRKRNSIDDKVLEKTSKNTKITPPISIHFMKNNGGRYRGGSTEFLRIEKMAHHKEIEKNFFSEIFAY